MRKVYKKFVADFETTVYAEQEYTEVWAGALVPLYTEDVQIYHSIDDFFEAVFNIEGNVQIYFHNLKFDGSFIIPFLIRSEFSLALDSEGKYVKPKKMKNKSFQTVISDMGQWYKIIIKYHGRFYEILDSLKLLPFSVQTLGYTFDTKHKKLSMDYEGFRYAGCPISDKEKEYISNDVLVVKEALEIMFNQGHDKLTIGSCCLEEFKDGFHK